MSLVAAQQALSVISQSLVLRFSVRDVPAVVLRWITTHPGQSALLVVNGVLIFTPAALTGPLLAIMGFGASTGSERRKSPCEISWRRVLGLRFSYKDARMLLNLMILIPIC
jgi:hypothetical protein